MEEIEEGARQPDAWRAWQQALAEVPATPALSGALGVRRRSRAGQHRERRGVQAAWNVQHLHVRC